MCRAGGRRCPHQNTPEGRAARAAKERERYKAAKLAAGESYNPHSKHRPSSTAGASAAEGKATPQVREEMYLDYGFSKPDFETMGTHDHHQSLVRKTERDQFIAESREELKDATEEEVERLAWYTGSGYHIINRELYEGKSETLEDDATVYMDNCLQRVEKRERFTYRGIAISSSSHYRAADDKSIDWNWDDDSSEKVTQQVGEHFYQVGSELHMKGYTSTSQNMGMALDFVVDEDSKGVIYEIKSSDGVNISSVAYYPEEVEVLLPRDKKFTVVGKHYGKVTKHNIPVVVVQLVESDKL